MIEWTKNPTHFRWSRFFQLYATGRSRIHNGYRYFSIRARKVSLFKQEYELSTHTVEGPSDFQVISFSEVIDTYKSLKAAKEVCIDYDKGMPWEFKAAS